VSCDPVGRFVGAACIRRILGAAWSLALGSSPLFCAALPASGEQISPVAAPANPDSALAVAMSTIEGTPLRLQEAIDAALQGGSTAARAAAAALAAARGAQRRERGAFDPELFLRGARSKDEQPTSSPFAGAAVLETKQTAGTGGARVTLPFGTEIEASLDASRIETNSSFARLSPQYDANGRIALRQPLLRGFGPGTGSEAKATKREAEAAMARYDDVILGVEALVERTYWDLYVAERDLAVGRLIRDQAQALAAQTEVRARAGLVGPSDPANARVFLAEREQAVLDREEELDQTSDRLAALIGRRPSGGLPRYHPVDDPPSQFAIEPEDSVVARAIRENRELRAKERDWAAAKARTQGAGWNRFPTLNFVGSLGGRGLSGTDSLPTTPDGDLGDAWSQVNQRDFPTWSAGLEFSLPLFLREGRGEYDRLRAESDQSAQDYEAARRVLEDDVRSAHRALVRAGRRFEAARLGADAAREQVRIGVLQYNSGRTTAFELVRLGADLAAAQQRYSQALVHTAKAAATLRFLTSGAYPARASTGGSSKP
jgi:outer membrane protein TolC